MRWLLFAQDGWGLGHVSRQIALARELRRRQPDHEFLFLTYSDATHLMTREGFPSLKIPEVDWLKRPDERIISDDNQFRIAHTVINACVAGYRPHAIITDAYPIGRYGELMALLVYPAFRFFVARENTRFRQPQFQEALARFHVVLAPYREGEVDLPIPQGPEMEWVGPILVRSREDALPRAEARSRLGLPVDGRVCLVTFGGGGNPQYAELEAWALNLAPAYPHWTFALAGPPLLSDVVHYPRLTNVTRFHYFPMAECFDAFDAAVATTGSSVYELAHFGVPSILVPHSGAVTDEDFEAKAHRIAGATGGQVVKGGDTDALVKAFSAIAESARSAAAAAKPAQAGFDSGAGRSADVLLKFIHTHSRKIK